MLSSSLENALLQLTSDYIEGNITTPEFINNLYIFCCDNYRAKNFLLDKLLAHKDESIEFVAQEVKDIFLKAEQQIKDINQIRENSPLKPNVTILLYGGYDHGTNWWLNGHQHYQATFIDFFPSGVDKMPVAFVELKEEIDLTEGSGLNHKGRYALLKLHFVANWDKEEIVEIHIVESLLDDIETFYKSHPFGTELETHASYKIIDKSII